MPNCSLFMYGLANAWFTRLMKYGQRFTDIIHIWSRECSKLHSLLRGKWRTSGTLFLLPVLLPYGPAINLAISLCDQTQIAQCFGLFLLITSSGVCWPVAVRGLVRAALFRMCCLFNAATLIPMYSCDPMYMYSILCQW